MVRHVNWTYCGDHSVVATNTEACCCSPETNIILYQLYLLKDGYFWTSLVAEWIKNPPANAGDMGSIPGPGRFHMLCCGQTRGAPKLMEHLSLCTMTAEPEP